MPPEFLPRPKATRRTFVQAATALAPAAPFAPSMAAAEDSEDYWAIKAMFPLREGIIPMNAANLCPSPGIVSDRVAEPTRDIDSDISHRNRAKFTNLAADARRIMAQHIGVDADEIALVRNTSEGNNLINAGLPLEAGGEIGLRDQNHLTNGVARDVRAARFGYAVTAGPAGQSGESGAARRFPRSAHAQDARRGADTPVERDRCAAAGSANLPGGAAPWDWLPCRWRAQTWGALRVKSSVMECDSFVASAHKWPMGPKYMASSTCAASGLLRFGRRSPRRGGAPRREPRRGAPRSVKPLASEMMRASQGSARRWTSTPLPRRGESRNAYRELAAELRDGLRKIAGVTLATPLELEVSADFAIISLPPNIARRVYDGLYSKYGVARYSGTLLCTHIYDTRQDVEAAIVGARELMRASCATPMNALA